MIAINFAFDMAYPMFDDATAESFFALHVSRLYVGLG